MHAYCALRPAAKVCHRPCTWLRSHPWVNVSAEVVVRLPRKVSLVREVVRVDWEQHAIARMARPRDCLGHVDADEDLLVVRFIRAHAMGVTVHPAAVVRRAINEG